MGAYAELVFSSREYRSAEEVIPLTGSRILLGQLDTDVISGNIFRSIGFLAIVVIDHTIAVLLVGHYDRRAIGDAELRIAYRYLTIVRYSIVMQHRIAQIHGLTGLTLREERSVTTRRSLDDFVLGWEEVSAILTGNRININDNAFLLVMHIGRTYGIGLALRIEDLMLYRKLKGIFGQILRIAYNPRDVIAFELEYQLDVLTDIILAQSMSERQRSLVLTTDNATGEM